MVELDPQPLTPDSVDGYAQIVHREQGDPLADNERFTYWDRVAEIDMPNPVSAGIVRGHPGSLEFDTVERHQQTAETLVCLEGDGLVLCAQAPDPSTDEMIHPRVFRVKPGEGFSMHPGIWHSPPAPVDGACKFLVLFRAGTPDEDLELKDLDEPVTVSTN